MRTDKHPGMLALAQRIVEAGFKKRAGFIFTRDLGDDVIGWVGLNTASHKRPVDEVLVNPVVGVRHQRVERVVADGQGERFHPYVPPTWSCPVASLIPGAYSTDLILTNRPTDQQIITETVRRIVGPGGEFMRRLADPSALVTEMTPAVHGHHVAYRYPVLLWQLGRPQDALDVITAIVDGLTGRTELAIENRRAYLSWLRHQITGIEPIVEPNESS